MRPLWLSLLPVVFAATSSSRSNLASSTASAVSSLTSAGTSASHPGSTSQVSSASSTDVPLSSGVPPSSVASVPSSGSSTVLPSTTSSATSQPATTPGSSVTEPIIKPPIAPTTFTPFPVPSENPVPGVIVVTDPHQPPAVGSSVVPDFGPAWNTAYSKAKAKVAAFSLEEKVSVVTGVGAGSRCVGNIPAIQPITGRGWPGLCLEDSPLGVRLADFVTGFPTGVNTAATFNRALIRARGLGMGQEHVGKGVNVALGPMMNMGRVPEAGRNWEGFGADPYLTGEAAYETILGMQQGGVQACAKHLVNNEQEHKRTTSSSDVDDRTQHEIYTHPFLRSIMAGVTSLMCSYNLINGTYACENDKIMSDIVKHQIGFRGYIMSDWGATESTMGAATGLDMTMPGEIRAGTGNSYFGGNLTTYVLNGTIPEARVDDMVTRILAGWYLLRQDSSSFPTTNFNANNPDDDSTNEHIDVQADHDQIVRQVGAASIVLLKNERNALPLKKPRSLVLIGSDAGPGRAGPNEFSNQFGSDGILAMGWGSGTANMTYLVTPLDAIQRRAREDHTSVFWFFDDFNLPRAGNVARKKSAALVFISADSGEGSNPIDGNAGDRKNLTAWHGGDALVQAVAAQNNNTIVVAHSVGPLIVEPWIDHPNVTAVLWAGAPGQEAGNSLTDVLYGDWNPSGRLPYTIAKSMEDYPAQVITGDGIPQIISIPYTEGLEIDYRHFDAKNITPRFEFGFGLSYTKFQYSGLSIQKLSTNGGNASAAQNWDQGEASPNVEGGSTAGWLHSPAYEVSFTIKNSGGVSGGESPQLYLNFPQSSGEPPSVLRGFDNVSIKPGQSQKVMLSLSRYDLSIWDVVAQGWRRLKGTIGVTVGASSRDARLKGTLPGSV
ncbi:glycoside hydrolase family 3 protein [Macrolepiota fuliginosa MF-IS2]|uniref:beta-glucosidase n=1 Tax=Macrolepiota fuliginosa MF-IS2 TaxID=1400762 RepID=A0A9P6C8G3_9AGAR|nr:glycoside hydrolase family 3 protein [Macrolepiota fuliginosa MF-IS2]